MDYLRLIISIVVCQLAGVIGSIFTARSVSTWYTTLNRPSFAPPSWVFAPVWITLFFMMGISLYLVWMKGFPAVNLAVIVFMLSLVLNILWSVFFFGLRSPLLGFIEIMMLWSSIVLTITLFYPHSRPAALLLVPYLLWVSFAAALNYGFYVLN